MANIAEIKAQLDKAVAGQGKIDQDIINVKTALEAVNTTNAALVQQVADQTAQIVVLQEQIANGTGVTAEELQALLDQSTGIATKLEEQDAALDAVAPDAPNVPNVPEPVIDEG